MPRISIDDFRKPSKIKPKRKRKPMTAEQKKAAAERLAKAREKKNAGKPQKQRYHPAVYGPNAPFKLEKVLEWHKYAKEQASAYKKNMNARGLKPKEVQHASDRYHWWYGYVMDINWYLKHGDWISSFHGKEQQHKTLRYTVAP